MFKRSDPLHEDHSKKNQNKYCRYHKDVGHTTEECIMLKDEIEKLIRVGTFRITLMARGPDHRMKHLTRNLHRKSGPSSVAPILSMKCAGPKNDTFEI